MKLAYVPARQLDNFRNIQTQASTLEEDDRQQLI